VTDQRDDFVSLLPFKSQSTVFIIRRLCLVYPTLQFHLCMISMFFVLSLRRLNHAYNAIAKLTNITNAVVTSFIVREVLSRESQSDVSSFASPREGICWLR
jgi:hypothetical protein